jgi:hypothetical protein
MKKKFKNLRRWNTAMGFLHLVQGVLMLVLSNNFELPITTNYLKFDPAIRQLAPQMEEIVRLPVGPLVALFLFMSSVAHLSLVMPGVNKWYVKNLKKGMNPARWIEYTFSSSVMIVIISMLVGVYDLSTLILIFSINAVMILCGLIMEIHNQTTKETNWLSYIVGCFAGAIPWVVIGLHLFGSGSEEMGPPNFVYWIFFSIFLFFNSFAINMILQYKEVGKWKDYTFGEKVYVLMSLFAKSALAWQVFAGTLRPE